MVEGFPAHVGSGSGVLIGMMGSKEKANMTAYTIKGDPVNAYAISMFLAIALSQDVSIAQEPSWYGAAWVYATPLISNGSFEEGVNPGAAFITLPAGSTAITDWKVERGTIDYIGPYWTAAEGQRSVDLAGNNRGAIQ